MARDTRSSFDWLAAHAGRNVHSLGEHELKGVGGKQTVYELS